MTSPNSRPDDAAGDTIQVSINGAARTLRAPLSVAALLAQLGVDPRAVAVERNRLIVRKDAFAATTLADGDALEIVTFVGGG